MPNRETPFSEAAVWEPLGEGWTPLGGTFRDSGFSIEWHDFTTANPLNWSSSFHPLGLEICLNFSGRAEIHSDDHSVALSSSTAAFYFQSEPLLRAERAGGEHHQFLTVEFSLEFLAEQLGNARASLHPKLARVLGGRRAPLVSESLQLPSGCRELTRALRRPPVPAAARPFWYRAKALEVASFFVFEQMPENELFCERQKRLNRERVEAVRNLLNDNLAESWSLEEIGRRVGCSHFHLSRIFSQEMGCGIFQHLRALRMEKAAELLREGKLNVTQVAMEVGYSSPSHFSTAFHEAFGCCPGLYPLRTLPAPPRLRSREGER